MKMRSLLEQQLLKCLGTKAWRSLIVLVGMLCLGQIGPAQAQVPDSYVHYTMLAGDHQSGVPGMPLPVRFAVRVTNWAGEPYVGVPVWFNTPELDDGCDMICYGSDYHRIHGEFATGETYTFVYTDGDGVATAPPWTMGTYPATVRFSILAMPDCPPYYFTYEQVLANRVEFAIQPAVATGVPVDNPVMLAGLGMSLALMAGWLLRRRVGG